MPDREPIETTAYSDYEPSVTPPPVPLTRAQVLTDARMLAAAINGVAAMVEVSSDSPRMRPEFLDAWRRWAGAWVGYHMYIERMPVNIEQVQGEVKRYAAALGAWRAGLRAEMGGSQPSSEATLGSVQPAPPAPVTAQASNGYKRLVGDWPWWAKVGGAVGLAWGGYHALKWAVRQWVGSPSNEEE